MRMGIISTTTWNAGVYVCFRVCVSCDYRKESVFYYCTLLASLCVMIDFLSVYTFAFVCLYTVHTFVCVSVCVYAYTCVCVCLSDCDWSITTQLSPSQMVQIWMPAWWFFQPQWGPEWLSEILEELEDRMRHKLDLLTKDNESDMQLSNLISLKHAENIQSRAASQIEAKTMFCL